MPSGQRASAVCIARLAATISPDGAAELAKNCSATGARRLYTLPRAAFASAWPTLALRFTRGANVVVMADRDQLRQVLANLCTNSANAGAASVSFAVNGPAVDVTDDGSGIPESIRPRIFDPYITTRRVGEGMGLGLAISRKILLDHGGDLALVETTERGTTFRLTLVRP